MNATGYAIGLLNESPNPVRIRVKLFWGSNPDSYETAWQDTDTWLIVGEVLIVVVLTIIAAIIFWRCRRSMKKRKSLVPSKRKTPPPTSVG